MVGQPVTTDLRILIFLVKEPSEDVLTIDYLEDEHKFVCKYIESGCKVKQIFKTGINGLFRYIENFIELICIDEYPFNHIQFAIPGYPSVLFLIKNFSKGKQEKMLNIFRDAVHTVILPSSQ